MVHATHPQIAPPLSLSLPEPSADLFKKSVFDKDKLDAIQTIQSAIRTNLTLLESRRNSAPYFFGSLKESSKPVKEGYGEYIVFRTSSSEKDRSINQKTYEPLYPILQTPPQKNRYEIVREKIKKIDPDLDIAFVPRTFYDLAFTRACIEEEMRTGINCFLFTSALRIQFESSLKDPKSVTHSKALSQLENCWHLCHFTDEKPPHPDHHLVILLARRLNNLLAEKLSIKSCLSGKEIVERTSQELAFFKKHFQEFSLEKIKGHLPLRGPSINFGMNRTSYDRVHCSPMVISAKTSEIIFNSIGLECSPLATDKIIIFRGGNMSDDLIIKDPDIYRKSLSYGNSLLAGALYDSTATVLYYGTSKAPTAYSDGEDGRLIYAIIVSPKDYQGSDSVFRIPATTTAICAMSSEGEFFHSRTRIIGVSDDEYIPGVYSSLGQIRPKDLTSTLSPTDFYSKLKQKQVKLILLSRSD